MSGINDLLDGFRKFRTIYYDQDPGLFRDKLSRGQTPRIAMVACSDSRVDPAIVLQTEPGDVFMIRNVAALVPPCEDDDRYHGASAALEFAVRRLGVAHLIVMGHAHCGGVAAMVSKQEGGKAGGKFIAAWTRLLNEARDRVLAADPDLDGAPLLRAAVGLSLENLATFPFVLEAQEDGALQLHGWYLDIFEGTLERLDPVSGRYESFAQLK